MRCLTRGVLSSFLALSFVIGTSGSVRAQTSPWTGVWKTILFHPDAPGHRRALCLIQIDGPLQDGKIAAKAIAGDATVDGDQARVTDNSLRLTLKTKRDSRTIVVYLPSKAGEEKPKESGEKSKEGAAQKKAADKPTEGATKEKGTAKPKTGGEKPKKGAADKEETAKAAEPGSRPEVLMGIYQLEDIQGLARLERTKELEPQRTVEPGYNAYQTAENIADGKKRLGRLEIILEDYVNKDSDSVLMAAALELLQADIQESKAKATDVGARADQLISLFVPFGREAQVQINTQVAGLLAEAKDSQKAALALPYAQKAKELLKDTDPDSTQLLVHKTMASALGKSGKPADTETTEVSKLEEKADKEYLEVVKKDSGLPDTFPAKEVQTQRVFLLELFTSSQSPTCAAAEVAFDALQQTYKPAQVVFLQYHLDIPQEDHDSLANEVSKSRAAFYSRVSPPTLLINGKKQTPGPFGSLQAAGKNYESLSNLLDDQLQASAKSKAVATIKLEAKRKGDGIDIGAEVTDVANPDDLVLRLVVADDRVRELGKSGIRLHSQVVRDMPGEPKGFELKEKTKKIPIPTVKSDAKHLKVIAFVQNKKSKEILQAKQISVPD